MRTSKSAERAMPQITSSVAAAESRRHYRLANGTGYWKSDFHRASADGAPLQAQAFLVEQEPNSTILSHFHVQDQFQVIVAGGGRLGTHEVGPISVHFAGAHTPYGPIVSGPEGLTYFTLRNGFDPGAKFMPQARGELQRGRYRFVLIGDIAAGDEGQSRARRTCEVETVLGPEPDGLSAQVLRVPPGESMRPSDTRSGAGQYHLVLSGSLEGEHSPLPVRSCIFVASDDRAAELAAGPHGAELLVLQFPKRA